MGDYDYSDIMRASDVNDVSYDVTLENVKLGVIALQQKTVIFIF